MTELTAVNRMLMAIGGRPVTSLSGTLPFDAQQAKDVLDTSREQVQSTRHWFNYDSATYVPDSLGRIVAPTGAVGVEDPRSTERLSLRDGYVYSHDEETNVLTDSRELVFWYVKDWDDLPATAQNFILASAKYTFASELLGDRELVSLLSQEIVRTQGAFEAEALEKAGHNIFHFDGCLSPFVVGMRSRSNRRLF